MYSFGGLAQLGEHLLCKQGVVGSIPSSSTTTTNAEQKQLGTLYCQTTKDKQTKEHSNVNPKALDISALKIKCLYLLL